MEKPFVLVADDSESTCTLVAALLQRDFSVDIARDGAEALERLKRRKYSAIVLDLMMPEADGFAVLDYLAGHSPELLRRVVVITAAVAERNTARARSAGVHSVFRKPFEVDALHAAVTEAAGGDRSSQGPGGSLLSSGMLLALAEMLERVR